MQKKDRVLLIINDNTIHGAVRFQKYGFLLANQYSKKMDEIKQKHGISFYHDWRPHNFGPYSDELDQDIEQCINDKIMTRITVPTNRDNEMKMYSLSIKGRQKWRGLFDTNDQMKAFDEKIKNLQKIPYYSLLRQIYKAYPEYTSNSVIRDSLDG